MTRFSTPLALMCLAIFCSSLIWGILHVYEEYNSEENLRTREIIKELKRYEELA